MTRYNYTSGRTIMPGLLQDGCHIMNWCWEIAKVWENQIGSKLFLFSFEICSEQFCNFRTAAFASAITAS